MGGRVHPDKLPSPVAVLGWDGTDFRVILVDGEHHPQVDVLYSALPDGAASEAMLADLTSAIGDPEESPEGSVMATLAEIMARLGDVADIRYQGDHIHQSRETVSAPTGVWTQICRLNVSIGEVLYVYSLGAAMNDNTNLLHIRLRKNGVSRLYYGGYGSIPPISGCCIMKATSEQYVQLEGKQESGGTLTLMGYLIGFMEEA